ncbi:MAG: hypothetical protein IT373_36465 [Polyangiaceae bacterium]|nr:hypothetical protein [Polyangiaceae bacterium]
MPTQRSSRNGLRVLVLGTLLCAATVAHADVGPAPQCPAGLDGRYSAGHYCAPRECASDSECEAGARCREQSLCLVVRDANDPDHPRYEHAGTCEAGPACAEGAACVTKRFCGAPVRAPTPGPDPTPAPRHGCGCELPAAASSSAAGAALLALALAGALGRRRRRR